MRITLLAHPKNEWVAGAAAAMCVGKFNEEYDWLDNTFARNLNAAVKAGHYSVLEHLHYTFAVEEISRAASHQLVRHRIGWSYSQLSQRYTKFDSKSTFCLERSKYPNANFKTLEGLLVQVVKTYDELITAGVKPEDARAILPNCASTSLIISCNARALVEASTKRLCKTAQEEIREMFSEMKELIKPHTPTVANLMKPPCDNCKELRGCHAKKITVS